MSAPSGSEADPLNALAEEFLARYRRGERPPLTEYTEQHPELAGRIRDLFPSLVLLEAAGSANGERTGAHAAPAAGLAPPGRLGDYRLLREVGRGGMGVVYEAVQESLGRHVALKVLPAALAAGGNFLERFRREARSAARLHHTNIVPVFGVGEAGGTHYYAMQFIQGEPLDAVLEDVKRLRGSRASSFPTGTEGPPVSAVAKGLLTDTFPPDPSGAAPPPAPAASAAGTSRLSAQPDATYFRSVARLAAEAAEALAYAHAQGVLHRDVKPSNLLLDAHGTLWITDFGLAKADDADDLTRTGDIVGTLRYMAPERFDGQADARSDVYALGVTLYEMLTLQPAFADSDRARLIKRVIQGASARPRQLDPFLPRDLETVVLKAMARDPGDRYLTAADLALDLRLFLADRPIRARRSGPVEQLVRWCRRYPTVAALAATVGALLAFIAVWTSMANVKLRKALKESDDNLQTAERHKRDADFKLWGSLVAQAEARRLSRRGGQRFESLELLAEAVGLARALDLPPEKFDEMRNAAIAALALPDLYLGPPWLPWPAGTHDLDVAPDWATYARSDKEGACSIRRVADDRELRRLPGWGKPVGLRFIADGRFLAVGAAHVNYPFDGRLQVWDLRAAGRTPLLEATDVRHVDFRPDGRYAAVAHRDGAASVYDLETGKRAGRLPPLSVRRETNLALHPKEPLLAACSYFSTEVVVRNWRTGVVEASLTSAGGTTGAAWSPDGRLLVTAGGDDSHLALYDRAGFRLLRQLSGGTPGMRLAFNPAGDRLAGVGWDSRIRIIDHAADRLLFATAPSPYKRCQWDRDGRRVVGGLLNERLGAWQVADAREYHTFTREAGGGCSSAALHPGGRLLAAATEDGVGLWDFVRGTELRPIPFPRTVGRVLFEPSGALLTSGLDGTYRWPVRIERDIASVGPPQRLALPGSTHDLAQSRDGRMTALAVRAAGQGAKEAGAWVLHADRPRRPLRLDAGEDVRYLSVSPDGRWVATGKHHSAGVKVWEAPTGRLVKELPGGSRCRFTPDGRWLATDEALWTVDTWVRGPRGVGAWAFSPDGKLAADQAHAGVVRLVEVQTGLQLARLEGPDLDVAASLSFTPDGTRLLAPGQGIHVWDLRALRRQLAALGLDWQQPAYPEAPVTPLVPFQVQIRVEGGLGR